MDFTITSFSNGTWMMVERERERERIWKKNEEHMEHESCHVVEWVVTLYVT